eukprot:gnl/TRDRNA2_/TRDRNA2_81006_c0_seq1.p1 gnl/TRDRNA2_/TRDRNA2_81006_c0~~gnl/TRDRNA2_/TRDRNA2_81006_c0_seq1.p1  ORF type:complete len:447 (+),score=43.51 gnl/TRDRNA2_/TRDRNA2_81006_c0_seq1:110-1450(+)
MSRRSRLASQVFVAFAIQWAFAAGDLDCYPSISDTNDDVALVQLNHRLGHRRRRKADAQKPRAGGASEKDKLNEVTSDTLHATNASNASNMRASNESHTSNVGTSPASNAEATPAAAFSASSSAPLAATLAAAVSSPTSNAPATPAALPVSNTEQRAMPTAAPDTSADRQTQNSTAQSLLLRLKRRLGITPLEFFGPGPDTPPQLIPVPGGQPGQHLVAVPISAASNLAVNPVAMPAAAVSSPESHTVTIQAVAVPQQNPVAAPAVPQQHPGEKLYSSPHNEIPHTTTQGPGLLNGEGVLKTAELIDKLKPAMGGFQAQHFENADMKKDREEKQMGTSNKTRTIRVENSVVPLPHWTDKTYQNVVHTLNLMDIIEGVTAPVLAFIAGGLTIASGLMWFLQFAGDSVADVITDNTGVEANPWHVWSASPFKFGVQMARFFQGQGQTG